MSDSAHTTQLESAIKALRSLKVGETYVYYIGFLDHERSSNRSGTSAKIAEAAYSLMLAERIYLTQRRLSPPTLRSGHIDRTLGIGDGFEYIATGRGPRKYVTPPGLKTLWSLKNDKDGP